MWCLKAKQRSYLLSYSAEVISQQQRDKLAVTETKLTPFSTKLIVILGCQMHWENPTYHDTLHPSKASGFRRWLFLFLIIILRAVSSLLYMYTCCLFIQGRSGVILVKESQMNLTHSAWNEKSQAVLNLYTIRELYILFNIKPQMDSVDCDSNQSFAK